MEPAVSGGAEFQAKDLGLLVENTTVEQLGVARKVTISQSSTTIIQRGHQNSLEMMPMFFVMVLLGGLQHPVIASALGVLYTVARFFYFKGYATGVPDNRLKIGGFNFLAVLGLIICTASFGINLVIREVI